MVEEVSLTVLSSNHSIWGPSSHPLTESDSPASLPALWVSRLIVSVSLQFSSVAQSCPALCDAINCSMPGLRVHHQLPELTQTQVHWVSDAIQPSHPLSSLLLLPPIPPRIRVFSNQSTLCIRWPKYWSCSFSISPSNEHPALISFRMDWLDLLAVQGTLKNLLQHHSSKHQFFDTQLSSQSNSYIHAWPLEKP